MAVVTPVKARVEIIGKLKESSYNPGKFYRSVLFLDISQPENSDTYKVWKSLSDEECSGLTKGSMVQLVPSGLDKNGKDRHSIVLLDGATTPTSNNGNNGSVSEKGSLWTTEQKKEIAAKVNQNADLLKYCLEVSKAKFAGLVESEESFKTLATTLFLTTLK